MGNWEEKSRRQRMSKGPVREGGERARARARASRRDRGGERDRPRVRVKKREVGKRREREWQGERKLFSFFTLLTLKEEPLPFLTPHTLYPLPTRITYTHALPLPPSPSRSLLLSCAPNLLYPFHERVNGEEKIAHVDS